MAEHEIFSRQTNRGDNNKNEPKINLDNPNPQASTSEQAQERSSSTKIFIIIAVALLVLGGLIAIWYYNQQSFINKNIEQCHINLEKKIVDNTTLTTCTIGYKDGDPRATEGLASIYYKNGDYVAALPVINKCADLEQINCQLLLSTLYKNGIPNLLTKDRFQALEWLERAHLNDSPAATFMLYLAYANGDPDYGIKQDLLKAKQYLKKAANLDYPEALYRQGLFFEKGLYEYSQDQKKAQENYERAVKLKSTNALVPLSKIYLEQDRTEDAIKLLKKADQQNIPEGSYLLAKTYLIKQDAKSYNKAVTIARKVLNNIATGDLDRQSTNLRNNTLLLLAELYFNLNDREQYTSIINQAIDDHVPTAAYQKAMAYIGEFLIPTSYQIPKMDTKPNMPDNLKMAVKYLSIEIENNDHKESLQQLFDILHEFRSQETDQQAFKVAQRLDEIDHDLGAYALGFCYGNGIGTKIDIPKAQELYTEVIKNDQNKENRLSLAASLAYHYYTGHGNIINDPKDLKLGDLFAELLLKSRDPQGEIFYYNLWHKFIASYFTKESKDLIELINNLSLIIEKYPAILEHNHDLKQNYILSKLLSDPKNSKNIATRKEQLEELALAKRHLPSAIFLAKQAINGKLPYTKPNKEEEEKYLLLAISEGDGWSAWRHATNLISNLKPKDRPYEQIFNELRTSIENGFNEATLTIIKLKQDPKIEDSVKALISNEDYYYYLILAYRDQLLNDRDLSLIDQVRETLSTEEQLNAENRLANTPF